MSLIGATAKVLLKAPIYAYRYTLSSLIGRQCRYLPTCSEYALGCIDRHGAWTGFWLGTFRICRCHPWGGSGYDPVPESANLRLAFQRLWRPKIVS
jgi:uncharacterized protein